MPLWQVENVEVMEDCHIKFDFLGKDSIRYENEVQVHPRVHELVREFCRKDSKGNRERPTPCAALHAPISSMPLGRALHAGACVCMRQDSRRMHERPAPMCRCQPHPLLQCHWAAVCACTRAARAAASSAACL